MSLVLNLTQKIHVDSLYASKSAGHGDSICINWYFAALHAGLWFTTLCIGFEAGTASAASQQVKLHISSSFADKMSSVFIYFRGLAGKKFQNTNLVCSPA